ncbi:uric acid degradation bifunctional protein TTL isoform X1 [Quercus lobata]|uniref:uric acid degradation bifunctional protein TTL isoform X1 n=1 Tax=Quercus lobata TaxID=97700 RepID=UPI001243E7B6|nr:uric acid degradation bifunctional protein TTL isoform X1 [Quercus lobata]
MESGFDEKDFLACCGSTKFAQEMALAAPFASLEQAVAAATDIWFNKVDVSAWLQAFSAHPQIGDSAPSSQSHHQTTSAQWSKGEQSTALATATSSSLQELSEWNARYRQKFGFIFIICASGRSTDGILAELKNRYSNRPIVEFEIAAQEQMKVTELRLKKLFTGKAKVSSTSDQYPAVFAKKVEEDRVSIIGGHLTANSENTAGRTSEVRTRTRPPITTHVLDVSRGSPAAGIEVCLEKWEGTQPRPSFGVTYTSGWKILGSSTTDNDGRSGQLLSIVDAVDPGIYRISFNTGKYCPSGFFPYASIVFEIRESQKREHFHVPLLLSPFSFSTYRGS